MKNAKKNKTVELEAPVMVALLALQKKLGSVLNGFSPAEGEHPVSLKVTHRQADGREIDLTLDGTLTKAESSDYTPTSDLPLLLTLALFVEHCGITREAALDKLREAAVKALELGKQPSETMPEVVKTVETTLGRIRDEVTKHLPKKSREGAVSVADVKLTVHLPVEIAEATSKVA
jgi:hypothetical protein